MHQNITENTLKYRNLVTTIHSIKFAMALKKKKKKFAMAIFGCCTKLGCFLLQRLVTLVPFRFSRKKLSSLQQNCNKDILLSPVK